MADLKHQVRARARGRCEYCRLPDQLAGSPHVIDHIIARQHRGTTSLDNLALSCVLCNRYKGPNIASIDPRTQIMTRLFNPRSDEWEEHFMRLNLMIEGRTAIGRATVDLLQMNEPTQVEMRTLLAALGAS